MWAEYKQLDKNDTNCENTVGIIHYLSVRQGHEQIIHEKRSTIARIIVLSVLNTKQYDRNYACLQYIIKDFTEVQRTVINMSTLTDS